MTNDISGLNIQKGLESDDVFIEDVQRAKECTPDLLRDIIEKSSFSITGVNQREKEKAWKEFLSTSIMGEEDTSAAARSILYILQQSVRYNLTRDQIKNDLDKIGLSEQLQEIIFNELENYNTQIKAQITKGEGFKIPCFRDLGWRTDLRLCDHQRDKILKSTIIVNIIYQSLRHQTESFIFEINPEELSVVINELQKAYSKTQKIDKLKNKFDEIIKDIL
ncbi:MAG: hypothetical protein NTY37_10845 [Methanothrix sp.]|nr:hypothetical protein [Methanothrix sp.]